MEITISVPDEFAAFNLHNATVNSASLGTLFRAKDVANPIWLKTLLSANWGGVPSVAAVIDVIDRAASPT